jgi:hypothetical protein
VTTFSITTISPTACRKWPRLRKLLSSSPSPGKALQCDPCRDKDSLIGTCEGLLPQRLFIRAPSRSSTTMVFSSNVKSRTLRDDLSGSTTVGSPTPDRIWETTEQRARSSDSQSLEPEEEFVSNAVGAKAYGASTLPFIPNPSNRRHSSTLSLITTRRNGPWLILTGLANLSAPRRIRVRVTTLASIRRSWRPGGTQLAYAEARQCHSQSEHD